MSSSTRRAASTCARATPRRLRVPGRAAVPAPRRAREPHSTASGCARRPSASSSAVARHRAARPRRTAASQAAHAFAAARSSASRSAARCSRSRASCCMDEPLAALDVPRKAEILDYIERLRDELRIPIVYVSHSVAGDHAARRHHRRAVRRQVRGGGRRRGRHGARRAAPCTGRYEAGPLIEATVTAHDAANALTTLAFDGGELTFRGLDACDRRAHPHAHPRARRVARALAPGRHQHPQRAGGTRDGDRARRAPGRRRAGRGRRRRHHRANHAALAAELGIREGRRVRAGEGGVVRPAAASATRSERSEGDEARCPIPFARGT